MKTVLSYLVVWISGIIFFTVAYTVYLRENAISVSYDFDIPENIQFPVYVFAGLFAIFLFIFKLFLSSLNSSKKKRKEKQS